jgi:hypothetical protein
MSTDASGAPTKENLLQHPYMLSDRVTYSAKGLIDEIDDVAALETQILDQHRQRPIDALIADDVSGRVLTLVTRGLMRLAQAGGKIDTIPRTYFMASGRSYGRVGLKEGEIRAWEDNLREHAGNLATRACPLAMCL